jgi:hypothetical protein
MSVLLEELERLAQEADPEAIRRRLREDFPDFCSTQAPAAPNREPQTEPIVFGGQHSRLLTQEWLVATLLANGVASALPEDDSP